MRDLLERLELPPSAAIAVVSGAGRPADGIEGAGLRLQPLLPAELPDHADGSFDVVVLDDVLRTGDDPETVLAEAARVARAHGLLIVRQRRSPVSVAELCAHFAGERLGVEEHRVDDDGGMTWLLRVFPGEPSPAGDR